MIVAACQGVCQDGDADANMAKAMAVIGQAADAMAASEVAEF